MVNKLFTTALVGRVRTRTDVGSRFKREYKPYYSDTGHIELQEVEPSDFFDFIQSFRDSCDLESILKRFLNGDENALNRKIPLYLDATLMPDNPRDWMNLKLDAERDFYALPLDIRAEFDNSPEVFFTAMFNDDFKERMSKYVGKSENGKPESREDGKPENSPEEK